MYIRPTLVGYDSEYICLLRCSRAFYFPCAPVDSFIYMITSEIVLTYSLTLIPASIGGVSDFTISNGKTVHDGERITWQITVISGWTTSISAGLDRCFLCAYPVDSRSVVGLYIILTRMISQAPLCYGSRSLSSFTRPKVEEYIFSTSPLFVSVLDRFTLFPLVFFSFRTCNAPKFSPALSPWLVKILFLWFCSRSNPRWPYSVPQA